LRYAKAAGAGSQSLNDWLEVIFSRALSVAGVHIGVHPKTETRN